MVRNSTLTDILLDYLISVFQLCVQCPRHDHGNVQLCVGLECPRSLSDLKLHGDFGCQDVGGCGGGNILMRPRRARHRLHFCQPRIELSEIKRTSPLVTHTSRMHAISPCAALVGADECKTRKKYALVQMHAGRNAVVSFS